MKRVERGKERKVERKKGRETGGGRRKVGESIGFFFTGGDRLRDRFTGLGFRRVLFQSWGGEKSTICFYIYI